MSSAFNLLTGVVDIDHSMPEELVNEGIAAFYQRPNDEAWGDEIGRVLYHESIHFWHVLASGYLANVVAQEWIRLEHYDATGEVMLPDDTVEAHTQRGGYPFSGYELFECWARFWDVHTGNPARILDRSNPTDLVIPPGETEPAYTGQAFDAFMQEGRDARLYAAPYRWILERCGRDSHFAACVFPIVAFAAFQTPNPVQVLIEAFDKAVDVDKHGELLRLTGNINFDWLNNFDSVLGQSVHPTIRDLKIPSHTTGLTVIERGPLRSHPVYAMYPEQAPTIVGELRMIDAQATAEQMSAGRQVEVLAAFDMAAKSVDLVYALPGQPEYRGLLGSHLRPPRIQFLNRVVDMRRPVTARLREGGPETIGSAVDEVAHRSDRFARAKKAASLGLPPDAFED